MSAVGASLAMEVLTRGIIVSNVIVYGIVIQENGLDHTRLLKLQLDFSTGNCIFMRCWKEFDVNVLMNIVVSAL